MGDDFLPLTIDVDSVTFDQMGSGEWEIRMEREGADDIYHYTNLPDGIYEQLVEAGDFDPDSFYGATGEGGNQ